MLTLVTEAMINCFLSMQKYKVLNIYQIYIYKVLNIIKMVSFGAETVSVRLTELLGVIESGNW